jgi:hypothetical protein
MHLQTAKQKRQIGCWAKLLMAICLLPLAFLGWFWWHYPETTLRYRLSVNVIANGRASTGSSVWEVSYVPSVCWGICRTLAPSCWLVSEIDDLTLIGFISIEPSFATRTAGYPKRARQSRTLRQRSPTLPSTCNLEVGICVRDSWAFSTQFRKSPSRILDTQRRRKIDMSDVDRFFRNYVANATKQSRCDFGLSERRPIVRLFTKCQFTQPVVADRTSPLSDMMP